MSPEPDLGANNLPAGLDQKSLGIILTEVDSGMTLPRAIAGFLQAQGDWLTPSVPPEGTDPDQESNFGHDILDIAGFVDTNKREQVRQTLLNTLDGHDLEEPAEALSFIELTVNGLKETFPEDAEIYKEDFTSELARKLKLERFLREDPTGFSLVDQLVVEQDTIEFGDPESYRVVAQRYKDIYQFVRQQIEPQETPVNKS